MNAEALCLLATLQTTSYIILYLRLFYSVLDDLGSYKAEGVLGNCGRCHSSAGLLI